MYNTLLSLSRNIFFYKNVKLKDSYETRIYLMFVHFSILMIISKKKGFIFDQKTYDNLFNFIENDLRELGFGDIAVKKKMKNLNKILYDLLLKLEVKGSNEFELNKILLLKYFIELNIDKNDKYLEFSKYFINFYHFCFELQHENMITKAINFKY